MTEPVYGLHFSLFGECLDTTVYNESTWLSVGIGSRERVAEAYLSGGSEGSGIV
jgi:hypothetical protein